MIFAHIPIAVNRHEVVRYLGYKKQKSESTDEIDRLIDKCIRESAYVIEAKGVIRQLAITSKNADCQEIECNAGEYRIRGERIFKHLQPCDSLTLMTVTVGEGLDREVERLFDTQSPTRALIIDAIGSDAVERAADYINEYVNKDAQRKGYATRFRFSPGYGGWSVEHQPDLLRAVDGAAVGITVTDSCQLHPRKSVSAVIGWYIPGDGNSGDTLGDGEHSAEAGAEYSGERNGEQPIQAETSLGQGNQAAKCGQCDAGDCQFRSDG